MASMTFSAAPGARVPTMATADANSLASLVVAALTLTAPIAAPAQVFEVQDGGVVRQITEAESPPAAAARSKLPTVVEAAATKYKLAPALVDAIARQESRYRAAVVSPKGAVGVMQLMPATAHGLHVDPRDPVANIYGGAAYLRQLLDRFGGKLDLALAAYNAGPAAVARYDGVPPFHETRSYVASTLGRLAPVNLTTPVSSNNGDHP